MNPTLVRILDAKTAYLFFFFKLSLLQFPFTHLYVLRYQSVQKMLCQICILQEEWQKTSEAAELTKQTNKHPYNKST